ncbi:hypothetical protein ZEAMMB73_Zm00001d025971 [Zea mays]|uniref:Uncharacterized protein n=1 Tax=Zea mays TaxID=4577 RepID=A0A1D6JBB3_MAIZE|nr:hypothetical protein ZEAMMB73_Zm00001d025971 [Zea mays]
MAPFTIPGDAGNGATITEMGNPVPEPSYEEAVLSVEEARLWSVDTVNCLDFDVWTTIVEETDKNVEVMFG